MLFEWDDIKSDGNLKKHLVSFDEAKTVFNDPFARISEDKVHSFLENRWHIIGLSNKNRLIITAFTERNDRIRIISARKADSAERKNYEKYKN
ncbi:MAG: BrnT family toxin [Candidatus Kapabacteria bacterium]|nr:BrnT family toxin [Candidatus Kapabacteria bacterium]